MSDYVYWSLSADAAVAADAGIVCFVRKVGEQHVARQHFLFGRPFTRLVIVLEKLDAQVLVLRVKRCFQAVNRVVTLKDEFHGH